MPTTNEERLRKLTEDLGTIDAVAARLRPLAEGSDTKLPNLDAASELRQLLALRLSITKTLTGL